MLRALLLVLAVLDIFDVVTTKIGVSMGGLEMHPLNGIFGAIMAGDMTVISLLKLASVVIVGMILYRLHRRGFRDLAAYAMFTVIGGQGAVVLTNILAIVANHRRLGLPYPWEIGG